MARGVNKVILIGNLGADPEIKYTQGGTAVCNLRIATGEAVKGQDGKWTERTEWHKVVVFGKTAENCKQYLHKGKQIYLEGRLQTRSWDDKQTGAKRYITEVVAREVQFLGGGSGQGQTGGNGYANGSGNGYGGDYGPPPMDDDIPF